MFRLRGFAFRIDEDNERYERSFRRYVLPNHMLMQIAEILPREMQGILACCNPVPTLVRQNLFHLHQLIAQARNQSINKVSAILRLILLPSTSKKAP